MHVKPASGRQVPDPEKGGYLPPEGREVEASAYWLRRLAEGDVTEAAAPAAPAAPEASPTKPNRTKGADK